jgi:Xaa-Pro dipeptidase
MMGCSPLLAWSKPHDRVRFSSMLDATFCKQRQKRLLDVMQTQRLDAIVVGQPWHVYYLSGHWTDWRHQSAFVLFGDGRAVLVSPNSPNPKAAADEALSFEANWHGTLRQEQPIAAAAVVVQRLEAAGRRHIKVGIDSSATTAQVAMQQTLGTCDPIDSHLFQLRRVKDADELALLKTAISATKAMYEKAREIIQPGVQELEVFTALHAAAVKAVGEPLSGMLGNDYACGVGGGPPRGNKVAEAGQLYILDLGPAYRGYFADNCRAISVDRKPTTVQLQALEQIMQCHAIVQRTAKPGVKCRQIVKAVEEYLMSVRGSVVPHHLGHGIGLQPHEFPHLNMKWDDTLLEGEVFTAEPGLYDKSINGGIRIENDYLVTKDGVENLTPFPTELA